MEVPVSTDGGIQHFPQEVWEFDQDAGRSVPRPSQFHDIASFSAVLELDGMVRSGHSAYFVWKDVSTGATYPMFMSDMTWLLKHNGVYKGKTGTRWEPCKRGQYYGIKVAGS